MRNLLKDQNILIVEVIISRKQDGTLGYLFKDAHGDVLAAYSSTTNKLADYSYNAWGEMQTENETSSFTDNPLRYNGQYYDYESGMTYLRARYYSSEYRRFITEDPIRDGSNWYAYAGNNPVMFVDPSGLEDIVVAGGAYHQGSGSKYQYEFVDSALKQIADMGGGATLLVANAGWNEKQYKLIVEAATERGIKLLWFSSVNSLISYINNGTNGSRQNDPITSFTLFAHGTDSGTGNYAITFGLYSNNDFRLYTSDISRINSSAFASNCQSTFYSCRTGNNFSNGNFAQTWANITKGDTYAYSGLNGRSQYSDINGHSYYISSEYKAWANNRGKAESKPSEAWALPHGSYLTSMKRYQPC